MPDTLTIDLHPIFRSDRDLDNAIRSAVFRALQSNVRVLRIIPGRGSGTLKRRVMAKLNQPHLRKLYRSAEIDPANSGRILVHF